ncbi:uncharacterized protein LOC132622675 [Lycium barbarum]|uniref:uncharacterized protein LOC132622675 n=1 Tax=Lycium barbarum TaxID=112863 RepID=UPI00293EDA74|nr:uncharacterized protein LOC132622675 [Lycium barbarum]XP_060193309.1 uncharacterized protein LOC132622675 [Lycium barbarum]
MKTSKRFWNMSKGIKIQQSDDSGTHVPLPDGTIHQAADDYIDHEDGIRMETDTVDVHSTKEKGLALDIQVGIGNESGDRVKVSTEEIVEEGDLSGEPKTSVERPADQTGKYTMEEKKHFDDSNNSEVIAQVLANIAESEMANEQVQEEKTGQNTSSTVLEEPQAAVCNAQPLSQCCCLIIITRAKPRERNHFASISPLSYTPH